MSEVVVDQKTAAESKRFQAVRNKLLLGAVVVVVLGLAAGAAWYSTQQKNKSAHPVKHATFQISADEYSTSSAQLKSNLAKAKTPQEKSVVYSDMSILASRFNKKADAVQYAQAAVDNDSAYTNYSLLADAERRAGDTQKAIALYKQAAALARQQGNGQFEADAQSLDQMAAALEQGQ